MSSLVVLVAPPGPLDGVRAVLHDWNAAGLIDDFVWTQPTDATATATDLPCIHVRDGRGHGGTVRGVVSDGRVTDVQLCVLVPMLDGVPALSATVEQQLAHMLSGASGVEVQRIRAVVVRSGVTRPEGRIAAEGWHNFVLAPEDRATPRWLPMLLAPTADPIDLGIHAAAAVAGLLGLWAGVTHTAVRGAVPAGRTARLVSSYYRRLVAGDAEQRLRGAVMTLGDGFPPPRRTGTSAVYVTDPALAADTMANAWWRKHETHLRSAREEIPVAKTTGVNWRQALRQFFSFVGAAIVRAPGYWFERQKSKLASAAASRINNVVYGSGSAYTVVVRGVTADGTPAGFLDMRQGASNLDGALEHAGYERQQEPHDDNSPLWTDFTLGALTLADGGSRVAEMPPLQVGPDIGILREADWIAPADSTAFKGVSGQLAAVLPGPPVRAHDVLAVQDLERKLGAMTEAQGLRFEVSTAAAELKQWRSATRPSYAQRVAERVSGAYDHTVGEIREMEAYLRSLGSGDNDLDREQEQLSRKARRMALGVLVALLIVVAVVVVNVLSVLVGIIVGALLLVVGIVGIFWTFYKGQQRFFQLINRQQQDEKNIRIVTRNLRAACRDIRRIVDAYCQLMVWTPVVARFLNEPFGRIDEVAGAEIRLTGPFPRGMRIGVVDVDPQVQAKVAAEIRRDIFSTGWLTDPWEGLISEAAARVGPDATDYLNRPQAIFAQLAEPSVGRDSLLTRFGSSVDRYGIGGQGGDRLWAGVVHALQSSQQTRAAELSDRVRILDAAQTMTRAEFLDHLEEPDSSGQAYFHESLLSVTAANGREGQVADEVRHDQPAGMNELVVVTQFSQSIADYDFVIGEATAPAPRSASSSGHLDDGAGLTPSWQQQSATPMQPPWQGGASP